jgi:cell division protein FtsB
MLGQGLLKISIYHGYILQILIAELMFLPTLSRRKHFAARLLIGLPVYGLLSVIIPNIILKYVSGLFSLTIFMISLLLLHFLFKSKFNKVLFCAVGAQLIQNLSYNIENLIYRLFPNYFDEAKIRWFCLSVLVMTAVYFICYKLLVRRLETQEDLRMKGAYIYTMSVVTALFVYIMQFFIQRYGLDRFWVTRPPMILCCILGLSVQFGFLVLTDEQAENRMLEHLIENERRQYENLKDSMDTINRKAHDLKHQIARIRTLEDVDREELAEIESTVAAYESCFQTGNGTLDVILSEKKLVCQREQIELSVIAQGQALHFLRPGEIASLFGNALDNAIECEQRISEVGKRCIALNVFERRGLVCIRIENYCTDQQIVQEGLPATTKQDRTLHGFGLRSIQYLAEKYNGTMQISMEQNLFVLNVLLPTKGEQSVSTRR